MRGRKFGPKARLELLTEENLAEMYQVLSLAEIGEIVGIARSSVARLFHEYGLETRTAGYHAPRGDLKEVYFARFSRQAKPPARPLATRRRIALSTWRMHILAERCPFTCPYFDGCTWLDSIDEREEMDGCQLEKFLNEKGELDRRPWEPEDYREQIWARLGRNSAKSLEVERPCLSS